MAINPGRTATESDGEWRMLEFEQRLRLRHLFIIPFSCTICFIFADIGARWRSGARAAEEDEEATRETLLKIKGKLSRGKVQAVSYFNYYGVRVLYWAIFSLVLIIFILFIRTDPRKKPRPTVTTQ